MVHHAWGVDAQIRDVVRRFAKQGYVAIAPDLFTGLNAPNGDGTTDFTPFRDIIAQLVNATVDGDIAAAAAHVRSADSPRKLGVTGFCMGGGITLRATVDVARTFAAAAMWYGKVRWASDSNSGPITRMDLAYADEVKIPLLGSFGGRDTSILPSDVHALDRALKTPHNLKVYDEAGHAFFDDTRPSYVPSAAADAWTRTLAWFSKYLS